MIYLAPSVLSADFANLGQDIKKVEQTGFLHVDVMDGHFVPNISLGFPVIKAIRDNYSGIMDVHLMISNPDDYIKEFKAVGADILTVHAEATKHLHRTVQSIKSMDMKAGVAINPATPVSSLEDIVEDVDLVLVMSVNPGFGGQKFIPTAIKKVQQVKQLAVGRDIMIQVDGGIDVNNVASVLDAGANVIVAGSAVFDAPDITKRIAEFNEVFARYEQ
ncbi:MAG: ribulose-phosphate 3-epimerase [Epulopiscium sp. Nele67-Bin004]|nr:MAG: ribulose-phosphate 3-epimerase [Epulopiscium sp. Nele67-Bin004]